MNSRLNVIQFVIFQLENSLEKSNEIEIEIESVMKGMLDEMYKSINYLELFLDVGDFHS